MRKPRSDSLYARLTPEQRDALMEWLVEEAMDFRDAVERVQREFGVQTSVGAVHAFSRQRSFYWRTERAKEKARTALNLPEGFEKQKKEALAQREFVLAFEEMTSKELNMLRRLEQEDRNLQLKAKVVELKQEDIALRRRQFQVKTCELFLKWHADAKARAIVESGISNSEKIEALGRAMFDDWEEEGK